MVEKDLKKGKKQKEQKRLLQKTNAQLAGEEIQIFHAYLFCTQ